MEKSPLLYARVGTSIKNGKIDEKDTASNFSTPITELARGEVRTTFMSGQSQFVHNEHMNSGSFGVSGAFGKSGVSKLTFAVSGYVGNAVAQSSKSVTVYYNVYLKEGKESIKYKKLSVGDLINAMETNPKVSIRTALDKYNELMRVVRKKNISADLNQPSKFLDDAEIKERFDKWSEAVSDFLTHYGEGFVFTVYWGAYGHVSMEMSKEDGSNSWKYGGEGNFTYGSPTAGVSVKATYDGSTTKTSAGVKVEVRSDYSGKAIEDLIAKWESLYSGKSYEDLANVNVLDSIPKVKISPDRTPSDPKYEDPKKDETTADKMGKIKDLNGLKALARAQAFDQYKKEHKDDKKTLEEFLNEADQPAKRKDEKGDIGSVVKTAETSLLDGIEEKKGQKENKGQSIKLALPESLLQSNLTTTPLPSGDEKPQDEKPQTGGNLDSAFVPIGIEICKWSDIFPWLAIGNYNSVDNSKDNNLEDVRNILKWRTMLQDFQALAILYYTAGNVHLNIGEPPDPSCGIFANEMGDAFANGAVLLQQEGNSMQDVYDHLNSDAQAIYKIWVKAGFLRHAELGLGYSWGGSSSIIATQGLGVFPFGKERPDLKKFSTAPCKFESASKNYSIFCTFIKFLPLILPDGTIHVFCGDGYLGEHHSHGKAGLDYWCIYKWEYNTQYGYFRPFTFSVDEKDQCLKADVDGHMKLYPIPFAAAKGIDWKGGALGSASLSSFEGLMKEISNIDAEFKQLKAWSFDSSDGFDKQWGKRGLSDLGLDKKLQYVGLLPEEDLQTS